MLRRARKRQDKWMYHQLTTIQVNVPHHRRATVNEVCFSTRFATAKMIMPFYKLSTTKAGVHHGSGCSAAPQRKCGEMSASGRLQKRTGARHKFPLNPLVYLCLLLEHMGKAQAQAKGGRPGLLSSLFVFKSAFFLRFLLLVKNDKKSKPLRCFELGVRGCCCCCCLWLTHLVGLGELENTGRSSAPRVYVHYN